MSIDETHKTAMKMPNKSKLDFYLTTNIICGMVFILYSLCLAPGCTILNRMSEAGVIQEINGRPAVNLLAMRQLDKCDCTLACLASVFDHWGVKISQKELQKQMGPVPKGGYSLFDLRNLAHVYGFNAFVFRSNINELETQCKLGRPCIVYCDVSGKMNHALVVYSVMPCENGLRRIFVMDPLKGKKLSIPEYTFLEWWNRLENPLLLIGKSE